MGFKSLFPTVFQSSETPEALISATQYAGLESSYWQSHKPSTSPRSSMDSKASTSSHESYASGKFRGRGVFSPARNAQYNFVMAKLKHRKELKREEEGMELPELTAANLRRLRKSNDSREMDLIGIGEP